MATLSWQQHLHLVVGFTGAEGGTLCVRDKCFELKVVPRVAMLYQPPLPPHAPVHLVFATLLLSHVSRPTCRHCSRWDKKKKKKMIEKPFYSPRCNTAEQKKKKIKAARRRMQMTVIIMKSRSGGARGQE